MDINTFRVIMGSFDGESEDIDKAQDKMQEKEVDKNGCLKLNDYMVF